MNKVEVAGDTAVEDRRARCRSLQQRHIVIQRKRPACIDGQHFVGDKEVRYADAAMRLHPLSYVREW